MIRSATLVLVLACAVTLPSPAAACEIPIHPKELAWLSPVIVTGTIVRVESGDPDQDLAHIRVEAVHKNVLKAFTVEPGGEIVVGMSRERSGVTTALHYPVGTRAIWITSLHDDLLRIDGESGRKHPVESIQELGRLPGTEPLYTNAEWRAREERARRWEERGFKAQCVAIRALSFCWICDDRSGKPSLVGPLLYFGLTAAVLITLGVFRWRGSRRWVAEPADGGALPFDHAR